MYKGCCIEIGPFDTNKCTYKKPPPSPTVIVNS